MTANRESAGIQQNSIHVLSFSKMIWPPVSELGPSEYGIAGEKVIYSESFLGYSDYLRVIPLHRLLIKNARTANRESAGMEQYPTMLRSHKMI